MRTEHEITASDVDVDVVVVGAGIAGLLTARRLTAGGWTVQVLEAKDRVGGRTFNLTLEGGGVVEAGGEWVYPTHSHARHLLEELGIPLWPQHRDGEAVLLWDGVKRTYRSGSLPLSSEQQAQYTSAMSELTDLSRSIDPAEPWDSPGAARYDAMTVAAYLERIEDPLVHDMIEDQIGLHTGVPANQISLLYLLAYVAGAGGWSNLIPPTRDRVVGGSQEISLRMARGLADRVSTGTPAVAIEKSGDGMVVRIESGSIRCRRVVVAMSPGDCQRLEIPGLPRHRRVLQDRWQTGAQMKAHVTYRTWFWREAGLSGMARTNHGVLGLVMDNTPHEGGPPTLIGLYQANPARTSLGMPAGLEDDPDARRRAVIEDLAGLFGESARDYESYHEQDWGAVPYQTGCQPSWAPGVLTNWGQALRRPFGGIHWCSTETAVSHPGWMDGAIESAERVAIEVARSMADEHREGHDNAR